MKITDKTKLLRALITATTKEIILEFSNCYLNIYCLGDTFLVKTETIQVTTDNLFTGYLVIDKNSELVNIIKDCCNKKSSELEFKTDLNNNNYLYYKRINKEELVVLDINVLTNKPEQLTNYLEIINKQEFNNEKLLLHKEYSIKTETKYEYEAIELSDKVLITSNDLELLPKVFDIEFNKQLVFKDYVELNKLTKKELELLKTNPLIYDVVYEDLVVSNSNEIIQVTNIEQDTYFYCYRCFKL